MNIGLCIGVFLLGVLVGFTGLIIVTVFGISKPTNDLQFLKAYIPISVML